MREQGLDGDVKQRTGNLITQRGVSGRQSRAVSGLTLTVATDLASTEEDWRLFEAAADRTPFQSYEWVSEWQRQAGDREGARPAIVIGRDERGAAVFLMPFAVRATRFGRRLSWLASEISDFNGPLLARESSPSIDADTFRRLWREILSLIGQETDRRFDYVDLAKMPGKIGEQMNPFMALRPMPEMHSAHVLHLTDTFDAMYKAKRSGTGRKRERLQFRHLAENGEVKFVEPAEPDEIKRTLETLFAQKAEGFALAGIDSFLDKPGRKEFFVALATRSAGKGLARVNRLDVADTTLATGFDLEFRGCRYLVLAAYDHGPLSKHGPGRAHLHALIHHAIDTGLNKVDFTIGDEPYKLSWSDETVTLYRHTEAAGVVGLPAAWALAGIHRAKYEAKQNPRIRAFVVKVRDRLRRKRDASAED